MDETDAFNWVESNIEIPDTLNNVDEEIEDIEKMLQKQYPTSARDILSKKVQKNFEGGNHSYKNGYLDGYREGLKVGRVEGYKRGYMAITDKLTQDQLPD